MTEHEHTDPQCVIRRRDGDDAFCRECDPVRMAALDNWTLPELGDPTATVQVEYGDAITLLGFIEYKAAR